jgi:hypothetical protein
MAPTPYTCPTCGAQGGDSGRLQSPEGWVWLGNEHGVTRYCSAACLAEDLVRLQPDDGPVRTAYLHRNASLFEAHSRLYVPPGARVLDLTYGRGGFWAIPGTAERYRLVRIDAARSDRIRPDLQADFRHLPVRTGAVDACVLDPPYANNGGPHRDGEDGVHVTYNLQPGLSTAAIHALYQAGIAEAARVLRPHGVLMVKCQDGVESGRRHWTSDLVRCWAEAAGFEAVDRGVLVTPQPGRMRHTQQQHARTNHSFLWTFRVTGRAQGRLW